MCQRTYSIPTAKGPLEVTKGTYLTLNKRNNQPVRHTNNITSTKVKAKKKLEAVSNKKKVQKGTKTGTFMKSIAKRISIDSTIKDLSGRNSSRMDEQSTWSHINYAVYSLSLSLSAANYDYQNSREM